MLYKQQLKTKCTQIICLKAIYEDHLAIRFELRSKLLAKECKHEGEALIGAACGDVDVGGVERRGEGHRFWWTLTRFESV